MANNKPIKKKDNSAKPANDASKGIQSSAGTAVVKAGSKLKVDYEGRFETGEVFDSSTHGDHSHPLEFEAGANQVIPGFDNAVIGMKIGEEREFTIQADEAYGEVNPNLMKEIPRSSLPQDQEPQEGMTLMVGTPQGEFPVRIAKVTKETVTIDLNHPLAGKTLIFKIKIVEIN